LAKAITGEQLIAAVTSQTFIKDGNPESAEGIKYDFHMGSRVLKAKYGRSMDIDKMPEAEKAEMVVEPGEVVFVLTQETLELPADIMAHLMPKRKLSHDGILVLGGFCVDPLYRGKLLVGLYNFSSSRFVLEPGRKLIAAVFYQLEDTEKGTFKKPEASVVDFPEELVRLIASYQPIDLKGLRDEIFNLENQISNLRTEITTDKEWKRDFQTKLERQAENIDKLLEGLEDEKENRIAAEKAINEQLGDLKVGQGQAITQSKTSHTLLVAVISIIVTFLLTAGLTLFGVWLATRK
jgi:deoxycytidine triphosphate deaminase